MNTFGRWLGIGISVAFGVLTTFLTAVVSAANAPPSSAPGLLIPSTQPADDETTRLNPRRPRTEQQQDKLHGMSLYAAARMADRASNHAVAVNLYSRAFRYDPQNVDALKRAVLLSRVLGRHTVAARYASELVQQTTVEPLDLLRGIIYLRQEGRLADALTAYEKGLADRRGVTASPAWVELHKQAGEMYLREKKFAQSADAFDRVNKAMKQPEAHGLDPQTLRLIQGDAEALWAEMAEAYLKAARFEPASEVIERSVKSSGDEGLALYARARLAAAQQKYDEALPLLDSYLEKRLTSQDEAPYVLLGEVLAAQKQPEQFKIKLQRALALDGENLPLSFFLAAKYQRDGQLAEARALYDKLLARKPSTAGFRGLIDVLRRADQVGPLLTTLGSAVGSTGGLSVLGDAKSISGDKELLAKLIAEADRRLKEKPADLKLGPRLALALLAADARQFDVAARFFELAIAAEPEQKGTLLSTWGMTLLASEQYAAAVDIFQRALDERAVPSDNPVLNFYLAGALSMVKRNEAALVAARKAVAPDASPEMASRVAWVHYRAKQYEEAREAYNELLKKLDPVHDAPGVRDAVREARLTLSHIYVLLGDIPQAEELLEQVLDEFPDNIGVRNDLGYLWADQKKHLERSLAMIQQAVAAEPDNAAYRDSLGWVLYRLGRYEEAVQQLKRASATDDPDGVVLDHLGDALEKAGDHSGAIGAWKRALVALEKEPDDKRRDALRDKISGLGTVEP
ncbi:MAG: tetratricopeptide repeat protein [Planctomycetes bacterium]|nr:tetratricopeptide repeat protein [Planctomycetota bacterium]